MAKSLLVPGDEEVVTRDVLGLKQRVHRQLTRYVGGRLCVIEMGSNKGSVVLVPADSLIGDGI